jgi:hypothetical protein
MTAPTPGRSSLPTLAVFALGLSLLVPAWQADLHSQELINLGAQPTVLWDHDGKDTTGYQIWSATGSGTPVKVGAVIPKPTIVGTTVEAVYPVKFSAEGTFSLSVSALNVSGDPNVNSSESPRSAPLLMQVKKATLPTPTTPSNFRLKVVVAENGQLRFFLVGE